MCVYTYIQYIYIYCIFAICRFIVPICLFMCHVYSWNRKQKNSKSVCRSVAAGEKFRRTSCVSGTLGLHSQATKIVTSGVLGEHSKTLLHPPPKKKRDESPRKGDNWKDRRIIFQPSIFQGFEPFVFMGVISRNSDAWKILNPAQLVRLSWMLGPHSVVFLSSCSMMWMGLAVNQLFPTQAMLAKIQASTFKQTSLLLVKYILDLTPPPSKGHHPVLSHV